MLDELGYGFDPGLDGMSGEPVESERWYHYHQEYGMVPALATVDTNGGDAGAVGERIPTLSRCRTAIIGTRGLLWGGQALRETAYAAGISQSPGRSPL